MIISFHLPPIVAIAAVKGQFAIGFLGERERLPEGAFLTVAE